MERFSTGIEQLAILAEQICFANATPQRKAIYYSNVSEPPSKLISHLEGFDFFDQSALLERVEFINLGDLLQGDAADTLGAVLDEVVRKIAQEQPALVVIDSAKALRDFTGQRPLRTAIYNLATRVAPTGCSLLFLGEYSRREIESGPEFSLADGIIELAYESRELLGLIQSVGASMLVTGETTTLGPVAAPAGGLSFLFQNVLFLRYIEQDSEIRRAIGVIKMRDSDHERGLRQFTISPRGFEVGAKLEGLTGLLGWSALREQERPL